MNASVVTVSVAISNVQAALLCLNVKLCTEEVAMLEDIASITGVDEVVTVKVTATEMMLAFKVTTESETALVRLNDFGKKDHFSVMVHDDNHFTVNKERKTEAVKEETKVEETAAKAEEAKPTETKAEEAKPAAQAAAVKEEVKVEVVDSWFSSKTKRNVGIGAAVCAVGVGGWFAWKKFHSTTTSE